LTLIRNKDISCEAVATAFINQIEKINPSINAIHQFFPEKILAQAKQKDLAIAQGKPLGKLHGLPISMKNHCYVKDFVCDLGSYLFSNIKAKSNATVVQRLLNEGAILLGMTNVPEMLIAYESDNLIYGRTNNPYDLMRTPGGSSGGEAALIAAGGSPLGIGSDAGGSIRVPAHYTGIVGHKPTQYLVPNTGLIPGDNIGLVAQLLTFGPMARYVEDLELILPIIAGADGKDPFVIPITINDSTSIKLPELKVAYFIDNGVVSPDIATQETMKKVIDVARSEFFAVAEINLPELKDTFHFIWETIFLAGDGGQLLSQLFDKKPEALLSPLLQTYYEGARKCKLSALELRLNFMGIDNYRRSIFQAMQNYDLVICPVSATPARVHETTNQHLHDYTYSMMFNLLGWPVTTIRAGTSPEGLPIGIQIAAKPFQDRLTLTVAKHLQKIFGVSPIKDSFVNETTAIMV
jgi:amidase